MSEQMSEGKDAETKPTETKPTEATVHPEDRLDAVKQAIRAQCEIEQKLNSTQHGPLYLWDFDDIARAAIAALSHSPRPAGTEAETIERCARVAEEIRHGWVNGEATTIYGQAYQQACTHIASAIRALTPQTTGEKDKL